MQSSLIILLLLVAAAAAISCLIVTVWWRTMMRNPRWVMLLPVVVPLILFGPLFAIDSAGKHLGIPRNMQVISGMFCLLAVVVVSFRGARRFHYTRRDHARPNV